MDAKFIHSLFALSFACVVVAAFYVVSADTKQAPPQAIAVGDFTEYVAGTEAVEEGTDPQTVLFTGDVMLARGVEWAMDDYGSNYPYKYIADTFLEHTDVVINFEASIPKVHRPTPALQFSFSVDAAHLDALADAGVTHASLANNHSFDFRRAGYDNTVATLKRVGVTAFGKPYVLATSTVSFIEGETNLALIGIDLTQSTYTEDELAPVFAYADAHSEQQVVVVHWGNEYDMIHSPLQEQYAKLFITLGADLVVGDHPHVVQDIAKITDVPVFYSLGNLIFDQYFSDEVQEGLMISWDTASSTIELIPVTSIGSRNQPRVMSGQEKTRFLEDLSERSALEIREEIQSGRLEF